MARIPGLDDLKNQDRLLGDIATKLDRIAASAGDYRKNVADAVDSAKDITAQLDVQTKLFQQNRQQGIYSQENVDRIVELSKQMDELEKKSRKLVGVTETLSKGFDKLGKGLLKVGGSTVTKGIDLLVEGIQRVYDLEERWAKVTGEVNQRLGKLSPSMRQFWKESRQAESTIRGLGGELGEGTKMFAEFTAGFNKMDTQGFGKLGIQLSQGFDLGAESSGKFLRTLDNLGFDERQKEASEFMKQIVVGAKTAGVSVNALAKDFAESSNFVARFGKEGARALTKSASYLKQFNVSLRDTEKLMDKFDTFDSAADSVAKLNVVFGTSINALNTMLEQDPAKRFEQIRQAMLAQGKTWDKLTYFERKAFTTATGLTEDQASAMLDVKNAGKSYSQFLSENAKNQRKEADAQKLMQQQLRATAKTLFNFGAAADRITVAIANAIKPFTDLLGLTKSGDKQWKSFSEVMESITKKIVDFFNTLAKNRQWKEFMEKAAGVTKRLADYVADFFSPGKIGRNIDHVINALKTFAKVSASIIALWAGGKVLSGAASAIGTIKDIGKLRGYFGAGQSARDNITNLFPAGASKGIPISGMSGPRRMGGVGVGAMAGGLGGAAVGSLFGASAGGGLGGAAGGAIGSIFGPIGTLIGSAVGSAAGIAIEKAFGDKKLERAQADLEKAQRRREMSEESLSLLEDKQALTEEQHQSKDKIIRRIEEKGRKTGLTLSKDEQVTLAERLQEMKNLGINVRASDDALRRLSDPSSGPVKLSADYIGTLATASREYTKTVQDLDRKSQGFMDALFGNEELKFAKQKKDIEEKQIDLTEKWVQQQIVQAKDEEKWYEGKSNKRAFYEGVLKAADERKLKIQTDSANIESKLLQQKQAELELTSLEKYNSGYQAKLKETGGDVVKALDLFTQAGGVVSQETRDFVKAQNRQSRAVGAAPVAATTTVSGGGAGAESGGPTAVNHTTVLKIDGREVARNQSRIAITQGHH